MTVGHVDGGVFCFYDTLTFFGGRKTFASSSSSLGALGRGREFSSLTPQAGTRERRGRVYVVSLLGRGIEEARMELCSLSVFTCVHAEDAPVTRRLGASLGAFGCHWRAAGWIWGMVPRVPESFSLFFSIVSRAKLDFYLIFLLVAVPERVGVSTVWILIP